MFSNRKTGQRSASGERTLIAAGTEVVGEIQFTGHVEIRGIVRGNIVAGADVGNNVGEASVVVLPGGKVHGDIVAPTVVIDSVVEGNIYAAKRVELAAGAEVCGDVHYQIIEMVQGSQVNGSLLYSPVEASTLDNSRFADTVYEDSENAADGVDADSTAVSGHAKPAKDGASRAKTATFDESGPEAAEAQDKQSALL